MDKKFDAVKFQRKIREKLSRMYNRNHDRFIKELHEKYGNLVGRKYIQTHKTA